MVVHASRFNLPHASPSSPQVQSLLFESHSLSLALMHSDSSFSLYPSISLSSLSIPPSSSPTIISPPSSAACFLRLHQDPNSNPDSPSSRTLFVVAAPHRDGSSILLRFYLLSKNGSFSGGTKILCTQNDLHFDDKLGVIVDSTHGITVKLIGSINYFAMYSISAQKVWVFAAKLSGDGDDAVRLIKCSVIECSVPIFSISISFGFLILGEENGVRVFQMRLLAKGRVKKVRNKNFNGFLENGELDGEGLSLPNGAIRGVNGSNDFCNSSEIHSVHSGRDLKGKSIGSEGIEISSNCSKEGKKATDSHSVKHKSLKLREDSVKVESYFVAFTSKEVENPKTTISPLMSTKAIAIQALSPKKYIVLDSDGSLHLLLLSNSTHGPEITVQMRQLICSMKVQKLAVHPDISLTKQTLWISDGYYSVHMMEVSEPDTDDIEESNTKDFQEKLMQTSVTQAIFVSERILDIVTVGTDAILILGEGRLFAYAIS